MGNTAQTARASPKVARIFLSYKRNSELDENLAQALFRSLSGRQHTVFVDRMLTPSEKWAECIETEIRSSDWLIVLLSERSCRSEMLKGEIELAREHAAKSGGKPGVLPIRVGYRGPLPYPLNAWLDGIQHAEWSGDADTPRVLEEINDALTGRRPELPRAWVATQQPKTGSAPLHSAAMRPPGGTADIDDPFYIVRESERTAVGLIEKQGQHIVIRGPRQTGKSSLLIRLASHAIARGKKLALIDFQLLDKAAREDPDRFFLEFAAAIADAAGMPALPGDRISTNHLRNCTAVIERHVLKQAETPLLVAIDEVDRIFGSPFRQDFFAMLRVWFNNRAHPVHGSLWKRLDLVLVTATEPYMFLPGDTESPFNVGEILRLEDFTDADVGTLCDLHGLDTGELQPPVSVMFGGHPYLTRRALYEISTAPGSVTPASLFEQALADEGPFRDHMRHHCLGLQCCPELARGFLEVLRGTPCSDYPIIYRLEGAGLVRRKGGTAVPRCQLYVDYFHRYLRQS